MKKAFFEDSAMAMAKLIVESIYHGMEENEGVYADLMYSNGKRTARLGTYLSK